MTVQELIGQLLCFPQGDDAEVLVDEPETHKRPIIAVYHDSTYGEHSVVIG